MKINEIARIILRIIYDQYRKDSNEKALLDSASIIERMKEKDDMSTDDFKNALNYLKDKEYLTFFKGDRSKNWVYKILPKGIDLIEE